MALTAVTVYTESRSVGEVVIAACLFGFINLPSVSSWTLLGQAARLVDGGTIRCRITQAPPPSGHPRSSALAYRRDLPRSGGDDADPERVLHRFGSTGADGSVSEFAS